MKTSRLFLLAALLFAGLITNGCGGSDNGGSPYRRSVDFKVWTRPTTYETTYETIEINGQKYFAGRVTLDMKPTTSREQMKQNVTLLVNRYDLDPTVSFFNEIGFRESSSRLFMLTFKKDQSLFTLINKLNREPSVVRAYPDAPIPISGG